MGKIKLIIFGLIFILTINCISFAHKGRTDSNGGHHVGGTSEYHYHHGYPAHQHTNGICPYKRDTNNNATKTVTNTINENKVTNNKEIRNKTNTSDNKVKNVNIVTSNKNLEDESNSYVIWGLIILLGGIYTIYRVMKHKKD